MEKLKDVASVVLVPTLVLYFFGFIAVTAYLSRFGIVTFDILNSRFLIAGIYPFISLASAVYLAWFLANKAPLNKLFEENAFERQKHSFAFLIIMLGFAYALYAIMSVGIYRLPTNEGAMHFSGPLRSYDWIGDLYSKIHIATSPSADLIVKLILYISTYCFLAIAALILIAILFGWVKEMFPNLTAPAVKKDQDASVVHSTKPPSERGKFYLRGLQLLIDVLLCVFTWP
ncbi:MAG: hypothetical protein KGH79_05275 [Patescibacteria group bacterium]|nr:hypothetical protein [Patescibacteria group bacterium]